MEFATFIPDIPVYVKPAIQKNPGGNIIQKENDHTYMTMIEPDTDWFKIIEVSYFDLKRSPRIETENTDKSYNRVIQIFDQAWIARYPCPCKVFFENGYKFKI